MDIKEIELKMEWEKSRENIFETIMGFCLKVDNLLFLRILKYMGV